MKLIPCRVYNVAVTDTKVKLRHNEQSQIFYPKSEQKRFKTGVDKISIRVGLKSDCYDLLRSLLRKKYSLNKT